MPKSKSQPDDSGPLFDWRCWETKLPPLKEHGQAKLNVLQQYIEDYITILCTGNPGQDRFRMTLVDGFAGGGIYEGGSIGSPFVLLRAFKTAEARVNMSRTKPIKFDCHFYFVEENAAAMQCLQYQLKDQGYAREFDESIFLIQNTFQESVARIVSDTQRRYPRGGSRVIFFLDQCGYSDVPPTMLHDISGKLHQKAEFIINIGIDWLTNYMANREIFRKTYPNLGLDSVLPVETILEATADAKFDPRYVVESLVGPAYQKVSGSPFFSPFYIQAPQSKRGYWLVHLAPQMRARSAMLNVYWKFANGARHFGHTGLDMLTYKVDSNPTGYLEGLEFSPETSSSVCQRLEIDFAKEIRDKHPGGISYQDLLVSYCNRTMASEEILRKALISAMQAGEINVDGAKGGTKRVDEINPTDVISPGTAPVLFVHPRQRMPEA